MKTVFVEVDTQIDFLFPAGALYVPGAERLLPAFAELNRFAAAHGYPLVSTVDAHSENDPEFRVWPPHCVAGTAGQAKAAATLIEKRVVIPIEPVKPDIQGAQQIVVEKRQIDPFATPNLWPVLRALGAEAYVLYGVVTEYCVRCVADGLLTTGKPVTLVTDAVKALSRAESENVLRNFQDRGGRLATVAQVTGRQ